MSCVCTHGDQLFCASYDRLIRCYNKTVRVGNKIILIYMEIVLLLDISTLNKTCNNFTAMSLELLNLKPYFYFTNMFKKVSQNAVNQVKTMSKYMIFSSHRENNHFIINYETPYFAYRVESCSGFIMVQGQRMD